VKILKWFGNSILFILKRYAEAFQYLFKLAKFTSIAAFLMISVCAIVSFLVNYFHPLRNINEFSIYSSFTLIELISLALTIGILEEVMFRYFIYDCMLQKWLKSPKIIAMVISSLGFGLAHANNASVMGINIWYVVPQIIGAAVLGFFFVWLYEKIGLHMCILVHALYDFLCIFSTIDKMGDKLLTYALIIGGLLCGFTLIKKMLNYCFSRVE